MRTKILGERQWKIFLYAALLVYATLCVGAVANWQRNMVPGIVSNLDAECGFSPDNTCQVLRVGPDSPLTRLGVRVGDRITFDRAGDGDRQTFAPHEPIGITIGAGARRRHVTVETVPMRHVDPMLSTSYLIVVANSMLALVLAGLIGIRRAASPSARLLALVLLMEADFAGSYLSSGWLLELNAVVLGRVGHAVTYCAFFLFTCRFPDDDVAATPAWTRRLALPCMLFIAASSAWTAATLAGWVETPPGFQSAKSAAVCVLVLLGTVNLFHAFARSTGALRQRVQWVGLATGAKFAFYVMNNVPGLQFTLSLGYFWIGMATTALANSLLAYGVLRHRLFDIGVVINRALVYAIVSATMLISFGLLEWLAHHFVSGGSAEESGRNLLLDGAIALGLYLGFHRLKHSVDHWVEKLFFHHWHENEARLRRFVRQAMHITSAADLEAAYLAALQRFAHDAGAVLYRRRGEGYEQSGGALMGAPHQVDINDALAVALRTEHAPVLLAGSDSALPGELALPMSFRGELQGFALIGLKPTRSAYRSDEIAALDYATQQVGLDLHALQTEQLQAELAGVRSELGGVRRELGALQGAFERYAGGRVA